MTNGSTAFQFTFDWGNIPLCTSGNPNVVPNPIFMLENVPPETKTIVFRLTDLDVPNYPHGGGTVTYAGVDRIEPGAFLYKSPCPPSGSHIYEWTANALDAAGKALAEAKASTRYP